MSYDLVLFDFDGVLFNTNRIKTDAFRQALQAYPRDAVDAFIHYHEATGGVSRYVKIAYFFDTILQRTDSAAEQQAALTRFAAIGEQLMANASPLPGVPTFLTALTQRSIPAAICSGGNRDEINVLLKRNALAEHFAAVWGNECSKAEHAERTITPQYDRVLFFGDAQYDMTVAETFGFDFVFVASLTDWPEGRERAALGGHAVIEDFTDPRLDDWLAR